jgi:hypothetical protein
MTHEAAESSPTSSRSPNGLWGDLPRRTGHPTNVRGLVFALACGTSWFLYLHRYTWNFIRPELDPRANQAERDLIQNGEAVEVARPGRLVLPAGQVLRNRSMLVFVVHQFMNAGADFIYVSLMVHRLVAGGAART